MTTSESASPNDINLPQLETEIKYYLNQINQNYIDIANNTIEIGNRLILAKSRVKHGEWQTWLQNNFQFSQNTAGQFMQVAKRFGKSATSQTLNKSQMIALLALPETDTKKFIEQKEVAGTPVSDMSVKTLRKEIKQWKAKTEKTIDIPANIVSQNQNTTEQTISNELDDTTLDNLTPVSTEPSYPEPQQPSSELQQPTDESTNEFNEQESFIPESPVETPETSLIEKLSNMSSSLIQKENRKEIIQNFAKNNPSKLNIVIQNLTDIISELKALSQKE